MKRVYVGLRDERGRIGAGHIKNGVRGYLERLAGYAKWGSAVLGKHAAKTKATMYVAAEQRRAFGVELERRSTLAGYGRLTSKGRCGLPRYLARVCPCSLRHGRRLKTKLRLGVHQLQACLARMVPRGIRTQDDSRCGCCSAGVDETIRHALFECSAHDKVRDEFLERATGAFPQFGGCPRARGCVWFSRRIRLASSTVCCIGFSLKFSLPASVGWFLAPRGPDVTK